jgi:SAM-dependent methyltransferase
MEGSFRVIRTKVDEWQMNAIGAQVYNDILVPAIFAPWVPKVLKACDLRAGQRVLDVACGTGLLTEAAARAVSPAGDVVGLDINPEMLAVAAVGRSGSIRWTEGDAQSMPFADEYFDRVLCQLGLQYFADQSAAVSEMHRVCRPGGRVTIMLWRDIQHSPGFALLAELIGDILGKDIGESMRGPFAFGDNGELLGKLLEQAGFADISTTVATDMVRFRSVEEFVGDQLVASPLGTRPDLRSDNWTRPIIRRVLAEFSLSSPTDPITFPIEAYLAVGRR